MPLRGKEYCNCGMSRELLEALSDAWIELALPTTAKEKKADAIIKKALDAADDCRKDYIENLISEYGKG